LTLIIEAIILGILTGSVYALMSSGLTLVFGVMNIVNIAQGIMVILGAYLTYVVGHYLKIDMFLGLLLTMPLMFVLGVSIDWAFVRRIKKEYVGLSILVMYAVALIIEGALNLIFSASYVSLDTPYLDASFPVLGFHLSYVYVLTFLMSIVLLSLLYLLVYRTKFGHSLQASIQNRTAAALVGIDVEKVQTVTFGIGVALAAALLLCRPGYTLARGSCFLVGTLLQVWSGAAGDS
jgi:branched-chain amino acid transport system permease protein